MALTGCAPRSAAGPVRVSRSSTSSIVSQNGTIAAREAAGRDERRRRSPSSASSRRAIPSIRPGEAEDEARTGSPPRVDLPIAASGSPRSIRGIRGAALGQRRRARSRRPGPIAPPRYSPSAETASKLIAGAEVDDHAGAAEALVGGDRVDQPVGADLVRVVDPDRHPGLHAGPDGQAVGRRGSARSAPRTRRPSGGTTEETIDRVDLAEARSRSARAGRRSARRARRRWRPARVWKRQCSTSSSPSKAPRWVWVLPTSIASSIAADYHGPDRIGRHGGREALRDPRLAPVADARC